MLFVYIFVFKGSDCSGFVGLEMFMFREFYCEFIYFVGIYLKIQKEYLESVKERIQEKKNGSLQMRVIFFFGEMIRQKYSLEEF